VPQWRLAGTDPPALTWRLAGTDPPALTRRPCASSRPCMEGRLRGSSHRRGRRSFTVEYNRQTSARTGHSNTLPMKLSLLCTFCLTLTGCVPALLVQQSKVAGRVIDSRSGNPIQAAGVHCEKYPERSALTDSLGAFEIPAVRKLGAALLGSDYLTESCTLTVQAGGYRSISKRVWFGDDTQQTVALEPM